MKTPRVLGSLLMLALGAASGCGGGSSLGDTSQFVGNWRWDNGAINVDCAGARVLMQDLTGMVFTIAKGAASNEIVATLTATCQITLAVSGSIATAEPAKTSCTLSAGGANQPVALSSGTLTPAGTAGLSADFKGTGAAGLCDFTGSGMLSRSPDGGT